MRRVGWAVSAERPGDVFVERGLEQWQLIKSCLPAGQDLAGRNVLDFGCGVGRILRHAVAEDPEAEYWACDIHRPSVDWIGGHLPQVHAFSVGEFPPLAQPDATFDLIYAFSVFTHLVDSWSAWLIELHRVLKDGGLLVVTVFGPGHSALGEEPIAEDQVGMNIMYPSASWDSGGPLVVHSEWWLRAHWSRAFEILELRDGVPEGTPPLFGQGIVVMRKRPGSFTAAQLADYEPDEPRELAALSTNIDSLRREIAAHNAIYQTNSWRLTQPLRDGANALRRMRSRYTARPNS
jgi:SAM-dependent methyltransferase